MSSSSAQEFKLEYIEPNLTSVLEVDLMTVLRALD